MNEIELLETIKQLKKEKHNWQKKINYIKNKEKILDQQKEYYEKNKEKYKEDRKIYRENNKEKEAERNKKYRENNRKKLKEANKKYRENNKEKIRKTHKVYYQKNKEKLNKNSKEYRLSFIGYKAERVSDWKKRGVISNNFDKLFELYFNTTNCENCNVLLTRDRYNKSSTKCLDHDHKNGEFRNVLCQTCNVRRK